MTKDKNEIKCIKYILREFENSTIIEIMIYEKPRHPQSKDFFEGAFQDYKITERITFCFFMKNRKYHSSINCTPYEEMLRKKLKFSLKILHLINFLPNINFEVDLEVKLKDEDNIQTIDEISDNKSSNQTYDLFTVNPDLKKRK
ncbi:hypothetical protein CWI38_0024p0020 [Hamiltosporidium tvaerminnensis]|uniref:Uncharacterized protein n=1 Tax=Hamiltosporidium tvaerminnensis TaxID=1176355 RepID=A0A4Q9M5C3_9MICR|nr:hypothetical protein CWI38_0024p0020 [Hamiltosporidium tvaerminnensis]